MDHKRLRALQSVVRQFGFRPGDNLREPIARAVGLRANIPLEIVDATAGLGRDAFLLASLGAQVTLIERVEDIHDQLAETLAQAAEVPDLKPIVDRMTLIHADAITVLADLSPATVLIDPMHPARKKSALVKKNMRTLRDSVGADPDSTDLIQAALNAATSRVVLKWPRTADLPDGISKPSNSITGKTVRYDVFVRASPLA